MIKHLKTNWYVYLKLAFIYAIMFQVSFVFDELWFSRTHKMLAYIFTLSMVLNILLYKVKWLVKLPLEFVLVVYIAIKFSEMWNGYATLSAYSFVDKVLFTVMDGWQFIVIGLCFLYASKAIHSLVHTRIQLSLFFSFSLVLMLIVDSFSPIILWHHIIVLVILSLFMLMSWHYEQIRKENEDEFEIVLKSPLTVFSPVIVVVSIATVLALILPYGPPLLEDPYALWKKARGEEVPAFLGEKGFKSQVRTNRTRQSGYSRSSEQLGGGFDFNYETVLEINTPQKSYWRGESINFYNGAGWVDTTQNFSYEPILSNETLQVERPLATTNEIEIMINVMRDRPYPVLFHASEVKRIEEVMYTIYEDTNLANVSDQDFYRMNEKGQMQVIYNPQMHYPGIKRMTKDNTLQFDAEEHITAFPSYYRITSDILQLDIPQLILTESKFEDPILQQLYTALPETLPQEVFDLAQIITSEATSDYERAKLIEDYLKFNYAYTNYPREERISGDVDDFVYNFLFELYEGYCDYFSTSMAVMAKALGMPARWVKGFAPGVNLNEQYISQLPLGSEDMEQLETELSGGIYNVRNADAHSWVEIYFEGYGWIAFEPTPGFVYPYEYVSEEAALVQFAQTTPEVEDEEISVTTETKTYHYRWIVIVLAVLLIITLIVFVLRRWDGVTKQLLRWRYRDYTNNERIIYEVTKFLRYCERRGLTRHHAQTVQDAMLNWQHGSDEWKQQCKALYQTFELARYSATQLDDKQVENVNILIKNLKKQWKV